MRPKKYLKSRQLTITVDDKDLSFMDDHRGRVTRGDYLIEGMYALKGEHSTHLKEMTEKYKQMSNENHELKRQLLFEQSRNKNHNVPDVNTYSDTELLKWYDEKNMQQQISTHGRGINWQNLYDKNITFLSLKLKDHKEVEKFCMELFKNNGSKSTIS